ncbi:TonB-dependent receptor plug domain-containing protein [Oceanicoccus sagamiensis]|uniref:TonB-dependent receptor plug domain-containing protein n=1 Tax=Oceanicoccus sagamiensis TaxID=716816 RepID=A0A1X9NGW8_9GAMM|nr:TonB-dependent receptor plug domain-containing protein [Oceanicoccus sagamiensis]ARN73253.1 hypothetical protein BST96_03505 [Oceanicoccus sagamiensis]
MQLPACLASFAYAIHSRLVWLPAFILLLLSVLPSTLASAQQSIQSYGPDFYASFGPISAVDIIDRIPSAGAVLNKANASGRGLNDNSQLVLINGKPVSAKSNSVKDVLSRIAAENVERVDVIRGGYRA